jgi:hypothetical protein
MNRDVLCVMLGMAKNLKFTFKRTVNRRAMDQCLELLQIVGSIRFPDEPDALI